MSGTWLTRFWTGNGGRLDLTDCDVLGDGLAWGVYTTEEATVRIEGSSIQNGICVSGNVLAFTGNKVGSSNIRANAVFKNNTFFHGGVTVFEGSPAFEDNVFEESPVTIGDSARAEFRRNRFTGESQFQNFGRMMVNGPDAVVVLEQNEFVDCQGDVLIGGNGCTIEARGNLFARNSGPVIVVDSTHGFFQDNTIQHNESPCVVRIKGDSAPTFIENRVDANSGIGFGVSVTSPSRIDRNVITGNQTGVMVQSATSVTLMGNQIAGNKDFGVFFRTGGRGTMVDNTITGNRVGMLVIEEAYVELTNNRVCDNHEDGVHCEGGG